MKVIYISKKYKYILPIIMMIILIIIFIKINVNSLEVMSINVSLVEKIEKSNQTNEKVAYLTFDDGPTKKETEKILDILKEEDVKATFFVVGKNVKEYPNIVKREYEEGHYIANHGYSHNNNKLYKNKENFMSEIRNTDLEISNAIGVQDYCSHIFRFPNGYMSKMFIKQKKEALDILKNLDYYYIDWNCLNRDSEIKANNVKLIKNLKETSHNQSPLIVLMHDTGDVNNTSEVLKDSIEYLKQERYEFKNMYDVLLNPFRPTVRKVENKLLQNKNLYWY